MGTLKIEHSGTSFTIRAEEEDEYLQQLLSYYKKVSDDIEKNSGLKNPLQTAILSGIMLCDEVFKERKRNSKTSSNANEADNEAERLTLEMIQKIDKALEQ